MAHYGAYKDGRVFDGLGRGKPHLPFGQILSGLDGRCRRNGPHQYEERSEQPQASTHAEQNAGPYAILSSTALSHLTRYGSSYTAIKYTFALRCLRKRKTARLGI
jgi:hypothetical protein